MTAYLDTHVAIWLVQGSTEQLSIRAQTAIRNSDLLISPMAVLEFEYLREVNRIKLTARDVLSKLEHELGVRVCDYPFHRVASAALDEKWTRDAFDRIIVAQAKANGLANLVSSDTKIAANYPRTVW